MQVKTRKNYPRLIVCSLLLLVLYVPCIAQTEKDSLILEDLESILLDKEIPGIQVMHVKDGQAHAYVQGETIASTGIPVQKNTIFQAASLSKAVFAYAALRLYDQGVFDLDTPLQDYWVYDRLSADPRGKKMTARMVLSHSTGLPNWQMSTGRPEWKTSKLEVAFDPGTAFRYSGEGFYFLQKVLEHLTGKTVDEIVQEQVLEPFGMDRSGFVWDPKMKESYTVGHRSEYRPYKLRQFKAGNAAYTLLTTAKDYTAFIQQGLLEGKGLKPETYKEMCTITNSAQPSDKSGQAYEHLGYGLGIIIQDNEKGVAYTHGGSNTGYRCFFIAYPETKESLVFFTNSATGRDAFDDLVNLFLEQQSFWTLQR